MNEADYQYGDSTGGVPVVLYVLAVIEFLLVWYATALLVGLVMLVVAGPDAPTVIGIGSDPVSLPGTVLGALAGLRSARVRLRGPKGRRKAPSQ